MEVIKIFKISGNIIDDAEKLAQFLQLFASVRGRKLLVHGGGKLATRMAQDLGIAQQMIDGRRVTDSDTLKIVTMVYAGYINKNVVAALQAQGVNAIGLSGADGNVIPANKRPLKNGIDYGFVGDVVQGMSVDTLKLLIDNNLVPILCPITHDGNGNLLNTNADTIAQEIAKSLSQHYLVDLIYTFEKKGVLLDVNDDASVIPVIDASSFEQLKADKVIFEGMIPKLENAFEAINNGVQSVTIGMAEELIALTQGLSGTKIVAQQ